MAYPMRNTVPTWDIPPPPGAEEYQPSPSAVPAQTMSSYMTTGFYTGLNNFNNYNFTSSASYYSVENDSNAHDRFSPTRVSGATENRYARRSHSSTPPPRHSSRRYSSGKRNHSRDRSSRNRYSRERDRYGTRHSRRSSSRSRYRSRSSSRYRRHRSRSDSRRRYRHSRSVSRSKYSSKDRRSRSDSRSRSYNSRHRKHSRSRSSSRSPSRSFSRSRSPPKSHKSDSSSSPSKEDITSIETTSRMSNTSQSSSQHRGLDRQSHKEFIKSKAQEYTNKTQQNLFDKDIANTFKNDGSFLEMFKKLQEEKEKKSGQQTETADKPEKILNIVAAASTLLEPAKPPTLPIVNKRRGGRVLKTGIVEKKRFVVQEEQPKDAWAVYMKEVKRYKEACCDDDSKTRPLVK